MVLDWKIIIEYLGWVAVVVAMIGTFLNAYGSIRCFYIWGISNVLLIITNIYMSNWSQTGLFLFNLSNCVYGIYKWNKTKGVSMSK